MPLKDDKLFKVKIKTMYYGINNRYMTIRAEWKER